MNKTQSKFFQSFFAANLPLFEDLVTSVCKELGQEGETEAMLNKFLYQDKKKFTKILNKKNTNNKRKRTTYSMFLADKTVLASLKAKYPELNLSALNKKKGEYWRNTVKQSSDLLAVYQEQADEANKLINKVVEPVVEEIKEEIIDEGLTTPPPPSPLKEAPLAPKKSRKPRKPRTNKNKQ